ncbi:6-phosphofructokinase [Rhizobiales bacterium Sp-1]|uniref:6-phosphofructokinase n=2 Tax=Segnochrobactrum spirostomi TaxID=2608987 RepID=A0A6A7YAR0_9HYPH|nr:6-phosphofructokinase [Segnochrobactrum spirostomi]
MAKAGPHDPADAAGLFLCGMNICVDARVDLADPANIGALMAEPTTTPARALGEELLSRVARGVGGEIRFDWAEGPHWLRPRLRARPALGGTGPQAAAVLAKLGARAVIPLEDRTAPMLAEIPPGVLIAEGEGLVQAADIVPSKEPVPEIYIFEYTAGRPVADIVPRRSSRIIVRFSDRGIQRDPAFEALSLRLAPRAAAALVSGFNDEAAQTVGAASRHVFALTRTWKAAGLETIHFELAGYVSQAALGEALANAAGAVTSLGMSHSELLGIEPSAEHPMAAMLALGDRLGLERVCVHADTWAASITTGDPEIELRALMAGCAVASARAATGAPVAEPRVDPAAHFDPLPFVSPVRTGRWTFVACAAPYLEAPATTLGLGDSFTAGSLLVLGRGALAEVR